MKDMLFSFQGRMRRSEWWAVRIGSVIMGSLAAAAIFGVATSLSGADSDKAVTIALPFLLAGFVVFLWVNLAAAAKRLHDQNMSGWIGLLVLVPYLGGLFGFVVLGCLDGARGRNGYGPSSKYPDTYTATVFD